MTHCALILGVPKPLIFIGLKCKIVHPYSQIETKEIDIYYIEYIYYILKVAENVLYACHPVRTSNFSNRDNVLYACHPVRTSNFSNRDNVLYACHPVRTSNFSNRGSLRMSSSSYE